MSPRPDLPVRSAQTKLKWAHVYEVAEPYHTEALWAAEEIKKRTNGKYEIQVFPASQLGNENQINEALGLGTVDMIYTGVAFAGSIHKPIAITNAPFVLRDFDHWKAYRDSQLFRDIAKGYEDKTKHKVITLTYYGERMVTANKEIKKPEDMKGMKLRVPPAPLFLMFTKSVGANATPIAFAEVYLALQQGTVDGQENPLPTIMAKKFYEVQIAHHADRPHHRVAADHRRQPCVGEAHRRRQEDLRGGADRRLPPRRPTRSAPPSRRSPTSCASSARPWSRSTARRSAQAAMPLHNDGSGGGEPGGIRRAAGAEIDASCTARGDRRRARCLRRDRDVRRRALGHDASARMKRAQRHHEHATSRTGPRTPSHRRARTRRSSIEHYPEDWIAFALFWALAFIVFLQFFTRYVLNDSLAWTEEIARYGLMWLTFIGGAMVTRTNTHIAVELLSNLMPPGPARARCSRWSISSRSASSACSPISRCTIIERMQFQRMTVFDLPMSYVYGGVALRLLPDARAPDPARLAQRADGWRKPHDVTDADSRAD